MSTSEDINTLYRRFGGDASDYQEIIEADQVADVQNSWPLLGHLNAPAFYAQEPVVDGSHVWGGRAEPRFIDPSPYSSVAQVNQPNEALTAAEESKEAAAHSAQSVAFGLKQDAAGDHEEPMSVAGLFSKYSKSASANMESQRVASTDAVAKSELKHLFSRLSGAEVAAAPVDSARDSSERSAKW